MSDGLLYRIRNTPLRRAAVIGTATAIAMALVVWIPLALIYRAAKALGTAAVEWWASFALPGDEIRAEARMLYLRLRMTWDREAVTNWDAAYIRAAEFAKAKGWRK